MKRRNNGFFLALLALPAILLYLIFRLRRSVTSLDVPALRTKYEKTLVVPMTRGANSTWLEELTDWKQAIYHVQDPQPPYEVKVNKGREANVYLTYIIQHYDKLPDIVVFAHEHGIAYHIDKAFTDQADSIKRLNLDHVHRIGYQSLRCWTWPFECRPGDEHVWNHIDKDLLEMWPIAFNEPLPEFLAGPSFAQFALAKRNILRRPKSDYERIHNWLMTTEKLDESSGRSLEHIWHWIFGMPAKYCNYRKTCLCEGFDICDKSEEWLNKTGHVPQDSTTKWDEITDSHNADVEELRHA